MLLKNKNINKNAIMIFILLLLIIFILDVISVFGAIPGPGPGGVCWYGCILFGQCFICQMDYFGFSSCYTPECRTCNLVLPFCRVEE